MRLSGGIMGGPAAEYCQCLRRLLTGSIGSSPSLTPRWPTPQVSLPGRGVAGPAHFTFDRVYSQAENLFPEMVVNVLDRYFQARRAAWHVHVRPPGTLTPPLPFEGPRES